MLELHGKSQSSRKNFCDLLFHNLPYFQNFSEAFADYESAYRYSPGFSQRDASKVIAASAAFINPGQINVRVQYAQILRQVDAVLRTSSPSIHTHLTAAVFRPVALDQIPVNAGPVAVVTARNCSRRPGPYAWIRPSSRQKESRVQHAAHRGWSP